jgi:glycosyltransferase involved in cell wall biosynthesis
MSNSSTDSARLGLSLSRPAAELEPDAGSARRLAVERRIESNSGLSVPQAGLGSPFQGSTACKPATRRRILIVVENLSVPFDRRVWRECMALVEAGYQVSAVSPKGIGTDTASRETIQGVTIYRYSGYPSRGGFLSYLLEYAVALLMSAWLALVVWFREGFDVIQICNPPDLLVLIALPFRLLGKRIVFDQHDLSPEIYQMQKPGANGSVVLKALLFFEKLTYRLADVVMVVNESCRRIAVGRGAKPDEDVFVVRNGPNLESFKNVEPNPALKGNAKHLLSYVGMMGPQEGIDILLRALRRLAFEHRRTDFHALIMGGGTVLEAMRQYAKDLAIEQLVTFTGHVDYRRVMEGIATADLCLCPDPKTPLNDKCSLVKVTEYMSLGRALVAFDLDEVRLSAADAALYATPNDESDFADKINLLLGAPDLRLKMGLIGRDRVMKHLAWEHSKRALFAAYDRAFSPR